MIITAKQLESLGACADQVELFRHLFGERQKVTVALCRKYAANFDWDWAAANLLSAPALNAYEEAMAAAFAKAAMEEQGRNLRQSGGLNF